MICSQVPFNVFVSLKNKESFHIVPSKTSTWKSTFPLISPSSLLMVKKVSLGVVKPETSINGDSRVVFVLWGEESSTFANPPPLVVEPEP